LSLFIGAVNPAVHGGWVLWKACPQCVA
jgi:hypothetical protein